MKYEEVYKQEAIMFNHIIREYEELAEEDIAGAYKLMKISLQSYNRWSKIKCDIKKDLGRGEASAVKSRLDEMCKYLKEVHITSRMIWAKGKDDLKTCREE